MITRAELSETAADGCTPLMRAAHEGNVRTIRALSKSDLDVNVRDDQGRTSLMFATVNRRTDAIIELLGMGADVNARDNDGATALIFAASSGDAEIVKILLERGADDSASYTLTGDTALTLARRNKHEDVVRLLEQYRTSSKEKQS